MDHWVAVPRPEGGEEEDAAAAVVAAGSGVALAVKLECKKGNVMSVTLRPGMMLGVDCLLEYKVSSDARSVVVSSHGLGSP